MSQWLEFYPENVSHNFELDKNKTLLSALEETVSTYSDATAFESFGVAMSFTELELKSRQFAAYLQNSGVKKGDRIALMSPNCLPFVVAMWGIIRVGAIQVNVNPLYTPLELEHQLNDAKVDSIVLFSGSTPVLSQIVNNTSVKKVIVFGLDDMLNKKLPSPPIDDGIERPIDFMSCLEKAENLSYVKPDIAPEDGVFLQYTGGTTGLSKGAFLTHGNISANIDQFLEYSKNHLRAGEEVIITAIPMYHIFALTVNALAFFFLGSKNVLITNPRDFDGFVAQWQAANPTAFTGVNTLYNGLLHNPGFLKSDFQNLNFCVGGGAPVQPVVSKKWFELTGKPIYEGYGLSETSPVLTLNLGKKGSFIKGIGLPLPATEISLRDEDDKVVEPGERGELCARGPQVMSHYWNRSDATAEVMTDDGFFKTGDIALQDADGFYHIVDRKKDMVLVSGFNVYPNEIEAVVAGMDGVLECACIGISDESSGEAVKLFVVKSNPEISEEDVIEYCRIRLTAYKVPKQIEFIAELPKSTVGKVLRRELR